MPAADSNKFITNNLPEFLLLVSQPPETVFTLDAALLRDLHAVIVCYDAHVFYRNRGGMDGSTVGLDEFVLYCDSKIQPQLVDEGEDSRDGYYRCLMTVSDLIRTEPWARLYGVVGTRVMRRLLFDCLLFVPLGRHVYYCVRSPSQHAGRYEVLQAFRTRAGSRWTPKLPLPSPRKYFNIAGLLGDVKPIGRQDSSDMLRGILQTDVIGTTGDHPMDVGAMCLDQLARKLKVMADKDTSRAYWDIYRDVVGNCASAEVPLCRVKLFARMVVRKIVPRELFGTVGNRDQYCNNMCQVLNGGKFHDYTVQHIVHKIKIKKINWLNGVAKDRWAEIVAKTLVWLINVFVFSKIVHCFRIVTTTTPNNGIVYVVKNKWANMCREKISPLIADGSEFFRQIQHNVPEPSSSSFYRNWKVCPYAKPNGVRLIFKLRRKEGINEKRLTDDCLTFLRCLSRSRPVEFRSVTRQQFFRGWKALQESRRSSTATTLYYVRTDFRDAFTSFMHDKLQTVVRDRIKERFGKKQKTVAVHTVDVVKIGSGGTVFYKKLRYVGGLPTPEFQGGSLVFHDKTDVVSLFRIWNGVRRCIGCNAVERGGLRWVMTRGVVQGDRLSVALCDLLLADLHADRLTGLVDGKLGCRLYRFVDDYIFVSPDRDSARRYLAAMRAGFVEYGLRLNRFKTETNLDDDGGSKRTVKFLGFRLNAVTGEVTKDTSAYRNRRPLHFFDYKLGRGRPGRSLYAKVGQPNWHIMPAVLVSKSFNSVATVARNVASVVAYKAFAVIAAVKQYFFHLNPLFLVNTVRAVARMMYANARASVQYSAVTPMQCKWIVYEVYATMFRVHFSPDDRRVASVVHQIRDAQTTVGSKCVTRVLRAALRRYDFAKMFG
ncbi:telomerase reverse transcriptase-like [Rhopalosiphum maidis]|uniref:telomerase reverse transcriptase-like n=1 Tax=Rhopalosiphum maidis TaxID=43146 RepID=UPI000EFE5347|nr:telomerase reverse transcriptase-like [Rhopalosiphum maidis]